MVPLNIWNKWKVKQLRDAIEEYGNAIRQLAAGLTFFLATCCLKTSVSPVTYAWFFMITMKFAT